MRMMKELLLFVAAMLISCMASIMDAPIDSSNLLGADEFTPGEELFKSVCGVAALLFASYIIKKWVYTNPAGPDFDFGENVRGIVFDFVEDEQEFISQQVALSGLQEECNQLETRKKDLADEICSQIKALILLYHMFFYVNDSPQYFSIVIIVCTLMLCTVFKCLDEFEAIQRVDLQLEVRYTRAINELAAFVIASARRVENPRDPAEMYSKSFLRSITSPRPHTLRVHVINVFSACLLFGTSIKLPFSPKVKSIIDKLVST